MANKLFTSKSLKQLDTPDDLNDYIKVANPGLWIILAALIAFLVGVCVWGVFGRIESKMDVTAEVSGHTAVCTLSDPQELLEIEEGMTLRIGDEEGTVLSVNLADSTVTAEMDLPDGSYDAELIRKSIAPISLITN